MIIGDGFLAQAFTQFKNNGQIQVFASGVSDSGNISQDEFSREQHLLEKTLEQNPDKILVYFSTCSIYDVSLENSPYVHHKLKMEELIKSLSNAFFIFRLSNPVGKTTNPHTLINFFVNSIHSGKTFNLWKGSSRNILDIEDGVALCSYFINRAEDLNKITNIANPFNYPIQTIITTLENVLGKKASFNLIDKQSIPEITTTEVEEAADILGLNFGENYLNLVLSKYYGNK